MLRTALLAAALALPGAAALAAPIPGLVPGATLYSVEAVVDGTDDFSLLYLEDGGRADLLSASDTPGTDLDDLSAVEVTIEVAWDVSAPTTAVTGFFEVFKGGDSVLFGDAKGVAGFTPGAIEVLFETLGGDVLAVFAFSGGGAEGAADPFAALSTAGDLSFHDATITLSEVAPIPLPAGLPLLLAGAGALVLLRRARA